MQRSLCSQSEVRGQVVLLNLGEVGNQGQLWAKSDSRVRLASGSINVEVETEVELSDLPDLYRYTPCRGSSFAFLFSSWPLSSHLALIAGGQNADLVSVSSDISVKSGCSDSYVS